MSKAAQRAAVPRACQALTTALLAFSWLGGAAIAASLLSAGYVGPGALALLALARVAARRYEARSSTASHRFPWIILWLLLDAATFLGAGVLVYAGLGLTRVALATPPWWGSIIGVLILTAGIYAFAPPIRSITRTTRRSRARATVEVGGGS